MGTPPQLGNVISGGGVGSGEQVLKLHPICGGSETFELGGVVGARFEAVWMITDYSDLRLAELLGGVRGTAAVLRLDLWLP